MKIIQNSAVAICALVALSATALDAQEFNIGQAYGDGEAVYEMKYNGQWYRFDTVYTSNYRYSSALQSTPWYVSPQISPENFTTENDLAEAVVEAIGYDSGFSGSTPYAYVGWDLDGDTNLDGFSATSTRTVSCGFLCFEQETYISSTDLEDYDDDIVLYYANSAGNGVEFRPAANSGAREIITTTKIDGPTPVPEINGSTIPLLAFILGVMGLGLKKRHPASSRSDSGTLAAA